MKQNKIMKMTGLIAVACTLASCANLAPLPTPTGKPEVTINSSDQTRIRSAVVSSLAGNGYGVVQDTPYSLVFSKQLDPGAAALVQFGLGNSYSSTPQLNIACTIVAQGSATRVYAHLGIGMQGVFGQNQGMSLDNGKAAHQVQGLLEQVKTSVEQR